MHHWNQQSVGMPSVAPTCKGMRLAAGQDLIAIGAGNQKEWPLEIRSAAPCVLQRCIPMKLEHFSVKTRSEMSVPDNQTILPKTVHEAIKKSSILMHPLEASTSRRITQS